MPTYDYQCRSCGAITEVIHPMLAPGPTACERCGGELRRVLYPSGIIFKGSGFYRTDSRAGDTSSSPKAAATDGAATADRPGAKPDAPAPKSSGDAPGRPPGGAPTPD